MSARLSTNPFFYPNIDSLYFSSVTCSLGGSTCRWDRGAGRRARSDEVTSTTPVVLGVETARYNETCNDFLCEELFEFMVVIRRGNITCPMFGCDDNAYLVWAHVWYTHERKPSSHKGCREIPVAAKFSEDGWRQNLRRNEKCTNRVNVWSFHV